MFEHLKENKILVIGFIVCLILASYVSEKKKADEEAARKAYGQQQIEADHQIELNESEEEDATSLRLPCGIYMEFKA